MSRYVCVSTSKYYNAIQQKHWYKIKWFNKIKINHNIAQATHEESSFINRIKTKKSDQSMSDCYR